MRLAEMQRALRDVLRNPAVLPSSDDPELCTYLNQVSSSGRVEILTQIMQSWRTYDVKRACPLTAAVLHARGSWESALERFSAEPHSPFVESLAGQFLDITSEHIDPLVASVARFERAYLAVLRGSGDRFEINWDCDPETVLSRLAMRMSLDNLDFGGTYLTTVARDLPHLFEISVANPH